MGDSWLVVIDDPSQGRNRVVGPFTSEAEAEGFADTICVSFSCIVSWTELESPGAVLAEFKEEG